MMHIIIPVVMWSVIGMAESSGDLRSVSFGHAAYFGVGAYRGNPLQARRFLVVGRSPSVIVVALFSRARLYRAEAPGPFSPLPPGERRSDEVTAENCGYNRRHRGILLRKDLGRKTQYFYIILLIAAAAFPREEV
jgi:hypothetical protein